MKKRIISVLNWDDFQARKDKDMPWCKLWGSLFSKPWFQKLSDQGKFLTIVFFDLARKTGNRISEEYIEIEYLKGNYGVLIGFNEVLNICKSLSHNGFLSDNTSDIEDKNRIEKSNDRQTTKQITRDPTLEEVKDHFAKNSIPLDAVAFFNHYESANWFRGKTKIKNWKACVNVWLANKDKFGGNNVQPQNKESHIQRHALNIEQTKQALREHNEFVARLASSKKATEAGASNK